MLNIVKTKQSRATGTRLNALFLFVKCWLVLADQLIFNTDLSCIVFISVYIFIFILTCSYNRATDEIWKELNSVEIIVFHEAHYSSVYKCDLWHLHIFILHKKLQCQQLTNKVLHILNSEARGWHHQTKTFFFHH